MTFRPSVHGWPFGSVAGVEAHVLGLGAPPTGGAALKAAPAPNGATPALGGGLCWAALDRYLRGVRMPRGTPAPEPGDPLHSELVRRQVASLSGTWGRVRDWQAHPDGSWRDRLPVRVSGGRDLASLTRAEWPSIRSRLKAGEPVLLTLLLPGDPYRRLRGARQVLATGWRSEDVRIVVSVYDPERPGDDRVELSFGRTGALDARLSGGSDVRAFMATPYDRKVPTPVRVETFGDRSVLGLNRKVRGRLAAVSAKGRLDLVGRNLEGALIHFARAGKESWEGANITDREELGSYELYSDPTVVRSAGLHIFARSYVGDLLHFRLGRHWSVANRTDHKRSGPRFRLVGEPVPVAGPWGRISVLGVDKDGGLVHYTGRPVLGWSAEQVAGDSIAGDPVAGWAGSTLHVAGRAPDGRVLHWEWDGETWTAMDLSTAQGLSAYRVLGQITLRVEGETVYIAGRSAGRRPVVFRKAEEGGWSSTELEGTLAGDPILGSGPAGIHLFAPMDGGGILHAWEDDDWLQEEVLDSRSSLPRVPRTQTLASWGSADELRVWGRADGDLWTLIWRPDSDWVLERLSERSGVADRHLPGDDPVVIEDVEGLPHLFFTDGRGTVLHAEAAEWREPGVASELQTPASKRETADPPETLEVPETTERIPAAAAETTPAAAPETTEPQTPEAPVPRSSTQGGKGRARQKAPDLPYMDFEADPAPARPEPAAADAAEPLMESDPEPRVPLAVAPEDANAEKEEAANAEADEAASAEAEDAAIAEAEESASAEAEEAVKQAEPEKANDPTGTVEPRESTEADESGPSKLEPMDLDLLDSWPTAPRSLRKRDAKKDDPKRKTS